MSLIKDNKHRLVGQIYQDDIYLGSCIPFSINKKNYILTSGHVIYGENFEKTVDCDTSFSIKTNSKEFNLIGANIITTKEQSEKYEVLIFKLEPIDISLNDFIELKFCSLIKNPLMHNENYFIWHPQLDSTISPIPVMTFSGEGKSYDYEVTVAKDTLTNYYNGSYGASAFKGISGSGLFIEYDNEIYLSGVLCALPKSIALATITVQKTDVIQELIGDISFTDSSIMNEDKNIISKVIQECINNTDDSTLEEWLSSNHKEAHNIERKLTSLYSIHDLPDEIKRTVLNLLNGKRILEDWRINKNIIYKKYEEANYSASQETMKFNTPSSMEAQKEFRSLIKSHKELLKESFDEVEGFKIGVSERNIIANRDISQWLAICNLNFTLDNKNES
ncbi:hypothetical protein [Aliivibrio fischeri]|uniref:hypothetical protein n=1 Tax=Aliivibrio fischeri TaxID=668 RepID=UPI00084CD60B|nr:hypothetical protein [Aliivibrio fischeri]OED53390.1 hypothetical protein BEI47_05790 [Aliivibrio fischeri]